MVFGGGEGPQFTSLHNDLLVVEMKKAVQFCGEFLLTQGAPWASSLGTKLKYPGREIVPLVHPILGFEGQEVNPVGMIRIPLCFRDKAKARTLEVDFLVVNVPTTYNVILGRSNLHKVEALLPSTASNPPPSWSRVEASLSRGVVSSSSRPPSITAGGLNSTNSGSRPTAWGSAAIFYVLNVRFKIPLYAEGATCQGQQKLPKELCALIISLTIALVLSLDRLLSLDIYFGLVLQVRPLGLQGLFLFLQPLRAAFVLDRCFFRSLALGLKGANLPPVGGHPSPHSRGSASPG
ncbi:LOW QUALITY PROTEIN: hypothetical protein Cgig2_015907 [Carnegiea gigantea]|uniref:Uncharacterized protein n=1 Tax=Carnegiea gigantea TaxID=171969 RepID=A0A9Q1JI90_9CARY|nr:LOW QUALITY PROTEIN: hypothetical protein Cgig2_015907 [Carnegiea gigantea]